MYAVTVRKYKKIVVLLPFLLLHLQKKDADGIRQAVNNFLMWDFIISNIKYIAS